MGTKTGGYALCLGEMLMSLQKNKLISKRISLAIATYNGANYLSELLNSLINQTVLPDEIIVVDDKSIDDTVLILKEYSSKLPIKIFENEKNYGVNLNFKKAVSLCSGDYILICDQDDVWFPENIETKVSLLEKLPRKQLNLVTSCSILTDAKLNTICNLKISRDIKDWKSLIHRCFQGTTMIFNRALKDLCLQKWPNSFDEFPYDAYIYFVALFTGNVYASSIPLMYYRSHSMNKSFHSGKFRNLIKRILPFHKLYRSKLTIYSIVMFDYVSSFLPEKTIKPILHDYAVFLMKCKKEHKIDWLMFMENDFLPLSVKVKTLIGSFLFFMKNRA